MELNFIALIQADAYNERLFSVSSEEPAAKQAYLQEISDNALHKRNIELTENDLFGSSDNMYLRHDKWKKYISRKAYGSGLS